MKKRKNIAAISGSIRKGSSNEFILQTIKERYSETLNVQLFTGLAALPHFDPDPNIEVLPSTVISFREMIEHSDGVLFCSPEYVFSLPAVLKNALEWCVATTIFTGKPVACIIASGLGEKAHEQLILIMKTLQSRIEESTTLILQGARGKTGGSEKITDEKILKDIDVFMQSFIAMIEESNPLE